MEPKKRRGFACMTLEKRTQIASSGGKAAHASGNAHQFDSEEARVAGRKGGLSSHARGTAHVFTSEEAKAAGRKGGKSRRLPVLKPEVEVADDGNGASGKG